VGARGEGRELFHRPSHERGGDCTLSR
jgi:hypothetical protein